MEMNLARMRRPDDDPAVVLFDWAREKAGIARSIAVEAIPAGDSLVVSGVEHGLHGHAGFAGRGSAHQLSKMNRRATIGHTHTAQIRQGLYVGGTLSRIPLSYSKPGPTKWSHSHVVLLANGKRQIVTSRGERYCESVREHSGDLLPQTPAREGGEVGWH